MPADAEAKLWQVDAVQQMFTGAQQCGRNGEVQLIDQARLQILPNGGDATADADVLGTCCSPGQ